MLHTLLGYAVSAGVSNRWLVIEADPAFFRTTKRIHNWLHGMPGDQDVLTAQERAQYGAVAEDSARILTALVRPGDLVVLHDPQTAGLAPVLRRHDVPVVWRCHVGRDRPNEYSDLAWDFLGSYLDEVDAFVFSRRVYAPSWAAENRLHVIPPSIDPFSVKNVDIPAGQVAPLLARVGMLSGDAPAGSFAFRRRDQSVGEVRPHAWADGPIVDGTPPPPDCPLVVQVSRWDRLKDMAGVMRGFAALIEDGKAADAHLMLVGPDTSGVADDPESASVLSECRQIWGTLADPTRRRVHLAEVPMDDPDENAVIVNAVQRHARVVVQKSLAEGFGLTVTEAMWKSRAVLASRVGGIQDQIRHDREGLLIEDPADLGEFAGALDRLLHDQGMSRRLGTAAHERVLDEYIGDRHLERYAALFADLIA